jgi:hypothetical protein
MNSPKTIYIFASANHVHDFTVEFVKLGVLLNIRNVHHIDWFLLVIWTNSMKIDLKMKHSMKISLKMAGISIKPYMGVLLREITLEILLYSYCVHPA